MRTRNNKKSRCHCVNIRRAANRISNLYNEYLAPGHISVNQYSLLANIDRLGCCSVSALAEQVDLERTTLVRTLRPLIARGLIEDKVEQGRREHRLALTEEGQRLRKECLPLWEQAQAETEGRLGPGGIEALEELLERLG